MGGRVKELVISKVIDLGILSESQISPEYGYIEIIGPSAKVLICYKIASNLTRFRVQITCHDLQFGQMSDTI